MSATVRFLFRDVTVRPAFDRLYSTHARPRDHHD